jgi:hypothetical protein
VGKQDFPGREPGAAKDVVPDGEEVLGSVAASTAVQFCGIGSTVCCGETAYSA